MLFTRRFLVLSLVFLLMASVGVPVKAQQTLNEVKKERGLTDADVLAAVKTFMPRGGRDEYFGFVGTGNSGTMIVYGIPSMRIYKYVGVFSPEPWQGYGYDDESSLLLKKSSLDDKIDWYGDMRFPALSETNGNYDGKHLFYSDGANSRIAMLDLEDFETKQVLSHPLFLSCYPEAAVTPNTHWIVQTSQYPATWDSRSTQLKSGITFWYFENVKKTTKTGHAGRILKEKSITLELPPYTLGYFDVGKGAGAGYLVGLANKGDKHYAYVVDYKKLTGMKTKQENNFAVVPFTNALKAGVIAFVELPAKASVLKVTPKGKYFITVDDQTNVFDFAMLKTALANKTFSGKAEGGIPVIDTKAVLHGNVDFGGNVIDVTFDYRPDIAYASVHDAKKIVRWNYETLKKVNEITLDFMPSYLMSPQSLSETPHSNYLTAVDKEVLYKNLVKTGPIRPSAQHLIDISGDKMVDLYTMTLPQCNMYGSVAVLRTTIKPIIRYPTGTNSRTGEISPFKTVAGKEKIERKGNRVHVFGTLIRSHITPEIVQVNQGDIVTFHLTNLELAEDETHGFTIDTYGKHGSFEPGKTASLTFVADRAGAFPYYCTEFCSALHLEMEGILMVKPKNYKATGGSGEIQLTKAELAEYKKNYENKLKVIAQTQDVINGVVKWLKENHYEKYPYVKALVQDAVAQLNKAAVPKQNYEKFAKEGKWKDAFLWAEQYFQYQVKAADAGLRARKLLKEKLEGIK
jgi:nitrous-oxide reductase